MQVSSTPGGPEDPCRNRSKNGANFPEPLFSPEDRLGEELSLHPVTSRMLRCTYRCLRVLAGAPNRAPTGAISSTTLRKLPTETAGSARIWSSAASTRSAIRIAAAEKSAASTATIRGRV